MNPEEIDWDTLWRETMTLVFLKRKELSVLQKRKRDYEFEAKKKRTRKNEPMQIRKP